MGPRKRPPASGPRGRAAQRRRPGFTLVEVLVALAIMAVVATLTWRGIDGMTRAREFSQTAMDRTLHLGTVLAQWERDLQAVQNGMGVPGLGFDGASLRLTRETEGGLQVVTWTLREGTLWRWASPALTEAGELQETWLRSQQLLGDEPGSLRVLDEIASWQVYFFRGNGWSNAQSAGDVAPPPTGTASAPRGRPAPVGEQVPSGVRLVLAVPAGQLMRDVLMNGPGY